LRTRLKFAAEGDVQNYEERNEDAWRAKGEAKKVKEAKLRKDSGEIKVKWVRRVINVVN
jgi:hypothetical protein